MSGRATRTEQVYTQLRRDILNGDLRPGARLPFAELSERYGGSTSAIREGLQRLVEQGLVVCEPQLGFRVMALSVEDLADLTVARCEIEGLVLRHAIESGDLAWETEIVAAQYALDHTPVDATRAGLERRVDRRPPAISHRAHRGVSEQSAARRWRRRCATPRSSTAIGPDRPKARPSPRHRRGAPRFSSTPCSRETPNEAVRLLEQHLRVTAEMLINSDRQQTASTLLLSSD